MSALYDTDYVKWLAEQKDHLQKGNLHLLDVVHLVEEIDDFRGYYTFEFEMRIESIIFWMLVDLQEPDEAYKTMYRCERIHAEGRLEKNPSLRERISLEELYKEASERKHHSSGVDPKKFPRECPWSLEEILGE